jgi:hypothetical protein
MSLIGLTLFNLTVWETRSYQSNHLQTKSDCENIVEKIAKTYWICTGSRIFYNDSLLPTGYVVGKDGYLVFISMKDDKNIMNQHSDEGPQVMIQVIGWWSIESLVPRLSEPIQKNGEFRIVSSHFHGYHKSWDHWDTKQFHPNCLKATEIILANLSPRLTGVFFLYGDPGLGKTTTARNLALKLNAWLCLDFEELYNSRSNPVFEILNLQQYIQPSKERPLIIVIDELDEYLFRSCQEFEEESDKLRLKTPAMKKNWGRMLDTIHQSQNIILLCTSNKPKSFFDDYDNALLRPFRITLSLHYLHNYVLHDDSNKND